MKKAGTPPVPTLESEALAAAKKKAATIGKIPVLGVPTAH